MTTLLTIKEVKEIHKRSDEKGYATPARVRLLCDALVAAMVIPHRDTRCPSMDSLSDLADEVIRARKKFPDHVFLFTALVEEVGELARAFIQKQGVDRVRAEALQVACVAMRIYEELDPVYDAVPDEQAKP